MLAMKPLFPIRCLLPAPALSPEPMPSEALPVPPDVTGPLPAPLAVLTHVDGIEQVVSILEEDAASGTARVRLMKRDRNSAVYEERRVRLARLQKL